MSEKILIVEDDLVMRETLAYNLDKEGYAVLTAVDDYITKPFSMRELLARIKAPLRPRRSI
jgi:DNA-binding response OmpR family regulator